MSEDNCNRPATQLPHARLMDECYYELMAADVPLEPQVALDRYEADDLRGIVKRDSCGDGALEALLILATVFRLIARRSAAVSAPLLQPHASGPASTHPDVSNLL
ncbi:unnamed protein product [Arctogadus glacialis]